MQEVNLAHEMRLPRRHAAAKSRPVGKDYALQVIDPRDPKGPKVEAIIPYKVALYYYKFAPIRYENLQITKWVLEHPERIFSGTRENNDGGWCFTSRPQEWYVKETSKAPFPKEYVFAVYLNSRFYFYEARAEHAADDDPACPKDWQNRYKALIWKTSS